MDDNLRKLIVRNSSDFEIERAAREAGMMTLYEDGILKVVEGITSMEEVNRVAFEV